MLIDYIQGAMRRAKYEILGGGEGFAGTIPGFKGLWASAATLEACRNELQDVLQSWMLVRIDHGLRLPIQTAAENRTLASDRVQGGESPDASLRTDQAT